MSDYQLQKEDIIFRRIEEECCHILERQLVFDVPLKKLQRKGVHALRKYIPVRIAYDLVCDMDTADLNLLIDNARQQIFWELSRWIK